MDLGAHLELGGKNLLQCLSSEQNYLPYWHMAVGEDLGAEYQFRPHCTGHNVGRWWNTMLRLEDTTGFEIPPALEKAMLENTWRLSDNPTGILLEDPDPANPATWYIHSYRETMLSFGLLAKYRASEPAREHGVRALEQMHRASLNLAQWDLSFDGSGPVESRPAGRRGEQAYTHGRAIEGLLCFYEATNETRALEEAERLAEFHLAHTINSDGSLADECGHHTHSYLNTIRGLLALAGMNHQKDRLEAIYATYMNAVSGMITGSGFVTHDIGARVGGDIASAGDIAHIALMLWDHFRDPRLLDDAERIARCRLIPAQVLEPMPLKPRKDEPRDCFRDLPQRFVGAIGGSVGHVKGQTCVTDFTAAALHSLIELQNRAVDIEDRCVRVNFHFDCERPDVRVKSVREGSAAHLTIRNRTGKDLFIRIPGWTDHAALELFANDKPVEIAIREGFALVPGDGAESKIELHYALPEFSTEEVWRDEFATQDLVTFKWRGDEICEVDPIGRYLAPFPKECLSLHGD